MSKTNRKSKPEIVLPPITVMEDEARRLNALASSSAMLFPRVAHFLAREMERAQAWWRIIPICAAWSAWARRSGTAMTRPVKSGTWCWCIRTKRT